MKRLGIPVSIRLCISSPRNPGARDDCARACPESLSLRVGRRLIKITDAYPTPIRSVGHPQHDWSTRRIAGGNLAKGFLTRFITFSSVSFRAYDRITVGASVKFSNKSSIEPHAVVAEIGPQKPPAGHADDPGEDDKLFDVDQLWRALSFVVQAVQP